MELAWSAQPGEEDTVVMIAHDITERNRVTRLIRESEEQFRTIIDSLPATVLTLNHAFQVTSANPATTRMFQFQPAELLGKDFGIIFTGTTVQQTEDASIVRAAQTQPIELQARRKDSTPIAVSLNVNRFINNDRENFLAVLQDITTRREIELVKRDFISMISHDLRSPLTSLHGTLGMMSAQIQDQPLAEETNKEREILMESEIRIGQLVNLINDFLDLEKIESGTFAFETTDVSVLKLIGAASEQMKTSMPDSDRTLSYANVDPTAKVRVDLDRMVMALLSFVSAIVRFSPNTSTAIITAEKRYGRTSMFVTAEGCTIPQETRETCLKRYAIVDFGQHETWTVSGLSLALARATIEAHQGALDIETRDGRDGFVFTLPG